MSGRATRSAHRATTRTEPPLPCVSAGQGRFAGATCRTLKKRAAHVLAYFEGPGTSDGPTEALNGVIEKTRRLAHGFRNFTNYRIRILLAADGSRPYRRRPSIRPEPS